MKATRWAALAVTILFACEGPPGIQGPTGGEGKSCTVQDNGNGTHTISCEDGTSAVVTDGQPGENCSAADNGNGTWTITCPGGTQIIVPDSPNLPAGVSPGLAVTLSTSAPANGTHFVAGEQIVVTIRLSDAHGFPASLSELSRASLYMYGPGDVQTNVAAVALLGASTDRNASTHHYINLKAASSRLSASGNVLTYTMNAITTEPAGTYRIGIWAIRADDGTQQRMELAEVQIGTATPVPEIVGNCGDCHRGAASGKLYMAHIDPGYSPVGNWALDSIPVKTCKACHSTDGYASYTKCSDGSRPVGTTCPAGTTLQRIPDPIVRRVHGVHNGPNLLNPFNIDPTLGDFKDYVPAVFPADIRNCTKCHLDDSWKTKPSALACGTCHDNVDFVTGTNHAGGVQPDSSCILCHKEGGMLPISTSHAIPAVTFVNSVGLSLSPPANGEFYTNESPVLTVVVKDATGAAVDPAAITETTFKRANLYVSGPRSKRMPVLTTAAQGAAAFRAKATATGGPWNFTGSVSLDVAIDGTLHSVPVSAGTFANLAAVTATEVVTWLNGDAAFYAVAYAYKDSAGKVNIKSRTRGGLSSVAVQASSSGTDLRTLMAWPTRVAVPTAGLTPANDFRVRVYDVLDDDAALTRDSTAKAIRYQLGSVSGLTPGTYVAWAEAGTAYPVASALVTFQVGTLTPQAKIATSCATCHADTKMHADHFAVPFDVDICGSCHDYARQIPAVTSWTTPYNMGFGGAPISRRVHGVHYGRYVSKPQEIYGTSYAEVIFPQDIRNCTTCHAQSPSWKQKPSRLVCNSCHDTDAALGHAMLQMYDPTPLDAWSGDELETCDVCHGAGSQYAPDVVHNISAPFVPPYPREPAE